MEAPEDVGAMVRLRELGWGAKRIARELGVSRNTVRRYLRVGRWAPYRRPERDGRLGGLEAWIAAEFRRHRGNAEVVRQELLRVHGLAVSLRTVERAVEPLRRELRAEARATVRFETAPGRQLQADFGQVTVEIGGERARVSLCVLTLGYSRRIYVEAFLGERRSHWFQAMEGAFRHFGGVPEEMLVDNARALVKSHDPVTREVEFTEAFRAFARHWGFRPRACAPYRARTKGKDERAVGYVKRNAIAGRTFESWEGLQAHLAAWMRETADVRVHGTTGERPIDRFVREEAGALRPTAGRAPFEQERELTRVVAGDLCVEVDTNHYSAPWALIGGEVSVRVGGGEVVILRAGKEVARHAECRGRRERRVDPRHFDGLSPARAGRPAGRSDAVDLVETRPDGGPLTSALLRPLAEYEAAAGGGW